MKKLISILHWTPLGVITVPVFIFPLDWENDKSFSWYILNGLTLGLEYGVIVISYFLFLK